MKHLLVFTENYARGGGNRYLVDLVNGLSPLFDQISILCNPKGLFPEDLARLRCDFSIHEKKIVNRSYSFECINALPPTVKSLAIKALKLLDPLFFISNFIKLASTLRDMKPAAVLACNGGYPAAYSPMAMVLASRLLKISCALSIVSMPARRGRLLYPYERLLDHLVGRAADLVIVNAHTIEKALMETRGFSKGKIMVIHNGVEAIKDIRRRRTNEPLIIGCIARMDRAKGVLFLFEAFRKIAERHQNIELVLIGDGDVSQELATRIQASGLHRQVVLTEHRHKEIIDHLLSFDLFVFPSLWEGFPYSILEAMNAGCPIITTSVGGIPEAVRNRVEGLLIPPGSTEALESAIEELINNADLRHDLGKNARKRFLDMFTIERMNQRLQQVPRRWSDGLPADKKH